MSGARRRNQSGMRLTKFAILSLFDAETIIVTRLAHIYVDGANADCDANSELLHHVNISCRMDDHEFYFEARAQTNELFICVTPYDFERLASKIFDAAQCYSLCTVVISTFLALGDADQIRFSLPLIEVQLKQFDGDCLRAPDIYCVYQYGFRPKLVVQMLSTTKHRPKEAGIWLIHTVSSGLFLCMFVFLSYEPYCDARDISGEHFNLNMSAAQIWSRNTDALRFNHDDVPIIDFVLTTLTKHIVAKTHGFQVLFAKTSSETYKQTTSDLKYQQGPVIFDFDAERSEITVVGYGSEIGYLVALLQSAHVDGIESDYAQVVMLPRNQLLLVFPRLRLETDIEMTLHFDLQLMALSPEHEDLEAEPLAFLAMVAREDDPTQLPPITHSLCACEACTDHAHRLRVVQLPTLRQA